MHSTRSPGGRAGGAPPPSLRTAPILPPPPSAGEGAGPASRADAETIPPPPMSFVAGPGDRQPSSAPPVSGVYSEELPTLSPPSVEGGGARDTTPTVYPASMVRTLRSPPPPSFDELEQRDTTGFGDDETPPPDTTRDPEGQKGS